MTYQGSIGFIELRGMQHMLHVSNYLLDDEPLPDDFINRFDEYELSWPQKGRSSLDTAFGLPKPAPHHLYC
jgi:hypothetical protein